jgi:hypothetical protein
MLGIRVRLLSTDRASALISPSHEHGVMFHYLDTVILTA